MEMITTDELGAMISKQFTYMEGEFTYMHEQFAYMHGQFDYMHERFNQIDERFDRVETRLTRVEEIVEDIQGTLIAMDNRISKTEYTLDEANPRQLKKRVEKLENHTFGAIQAA
jgi:archaellum component FlaC